MTNKHIGSSLNEVIDTQLKDLDFSREFEKQEMISQIAQKAYNLRLKAGLTQKAMAERSQTTQQVIARIESGKDQRVPSLELLNRIARAAGKHLEISFA
jgi:DNA-binding XRE family transcriptional regulator